MDSDRELLELAAKAAGYTTNHPWNAERLTMNPPVDALCIEDANGLVHTAWNPLDDSGAALNLAVKIELVLSMKPSRGYVMAGRGDQSTHYEETSSDPATSTRRAIVRAAAEIGKAMP